ncbi:MAG: chromosome segregation protein SMC [Thermoleophilia bacterium]|nr:chromosome segregation protein SMC [Thermoleophilia bacterium]
MLTRLSLRGFKSFAEPVELRFGPGVNVIVGPNGSGKSNVAEAILWALGEQRPARLRAPGMQDVLFSGGPGRQAVGVAEVTMGLAGPGGEGRPAELEVTRRLTRAGDAGYRLNGGRCRLLDVQDALATHGLGPRSLSVIRQGQVEAVCASHPAELRAVLDEAAGVGLPKRRRRRAEQRLARLDDRLARARDLAVELGDRARALDRQARAAERAQDADRDLAQANAALAAARRRAAAGDLALARAQQAAAAEVARAADERLGDARGARDAAAAERAAAAASHEAAVALASEVRAAADRLAGRAEVGAERLAAAREGAERRGAEADAARRELATLEAEAHAARSRVERAREALAAAEDTLAGAEGAEREAVARAAEAQAHADAARADRAAAERRHAGAERAAREAAGRRDREAARLAQADALPAPDLARLERRAEVSAARAARDAARMEDAARAAADLAAVRAAADARLREVRAAARRAEPAAGEAGDAGTLGAGLEVEPGLERAVAAALGDLADAPLVSGVEAGARAIAAGAPAACVAPPARGTAHPPPVPGAQPLLAAVRACPDAARPHVERALGEAWLVGGLDPAPAANGSLLVTAEGLALRPATGVLRGERGAWARRAVHRRLLDDVRAAEADAQAAAVTWADADGRLRAAERRRRTTERGAARADARLRAGRESARRRDAERDDAAARAARADADARAAAADLDDAARALAVLAAAGGSGTDAREAQVAAEAARAARAAAARDRDAARQAAAAAEGGLAAVEVRRARARAVADAPGRAADHADAGRAVQALRAAAGALGPHADAAAGRMTTRRAALAAADRDLAAAEAEASAAERAAGAHRGAAQEAEVGLALAAERAREAGLDPDGPAAPGPLPGDDVPALEARVADLERRRRALGEVNPLAADERAELAERQAEIDGQVADVEAAAAALRGHLGELDAAVAEGFDEVLDAVGRRFTEVVGLLFPGGEGRIRPVALEGEDGVVVEVVPAGKRPRALSLLSGGERSLVALAFCLAVAMARPAPFYLLDEVEAALDDVNLRRFLGVVRRLAGDTQFLLITHQQPTVETADTLFGVTMGGNGVSQVLARRLDRNPEGAARPWVRRAMGGSARMGA